MPELEYLEPGERLRDFLGVAERELLIVAPFVKVEALRRLLSKRRATAEVTFVTRWRADEIALGVSDVGAFDVIAELSGKTFLVNRLHAKYFRSDSRVLMGSANVTATALGWARTPNLELLGEIPRDESSYSFERTLFAEGIEVDEQLASRFREIELEVRSSDPNPVGPEAAQATDEGPDLLRLLPRDPRDLWLAYISENDLLSPDQSGRMRELLRYLGLPVGLQDEGSLVAAAGAAMWLDPIVAEFYRWLEVDRRFGEVTDFIQERTQSSREAASYDAQTLLRALLHFLPTRFQSDRPRYSEIVRRR